MTARKLSPVQQPERLREEIRNAGILHGDTVRATIMGIRLHPMAGVPEGMQLRFCDIDRLLVDEAIGRGDGGELPADVVVDGMRMRSTGTWTAENVIISSNGVISVTADENSRFIRTSEQYSNWYSTSAAD